MNWDSEIWLPCRLGEAFTLWDLGHEVKRYLYSVQPDWLGGHGDCGCVCSPAAWKNGQPYNVRVGAGPRPWTKCWNYEPAIKITPPTWIWDYNEDIRFGIFLPQKRDGTRQMIRLQSVSMRGSRAYFNFTIKGKGLGGDIHLERVAALDPYFVPVWPMPLPEPPKPAFYYYYIPDSDQ